MNKLTHVESQRIMALLEETIQKIQLISLVTRDSGSIPSDISELLTENITAIIKQHKMYEDQFSEMILRKADENSLREMSAKLKQSSLGLCRVLMHTPTMTDKIKQHQLGAIGIRTQPIRAFIKNLTELKDLTYTRLTTTVEEEKSKQDFLLDIQLKEQKSSVELKNLQSQLNELRLKHEREVNAKNNIINKLKDEIQAIKANSSIEMKRLEQENLTIETKDIKEHQERDTHQNEDLLKLHQNLEEIVKSNKKVEHNLRKKKMKTESEVEKWIKKYDTEMEEKETKIETITSEYEAIKKELVELEESYNKLCKERDEILAEERRIQDEQMSEQEKIRHLHHSAAVIQRWWREKQRKLKSEKKTQKRARTTSRRGRSRSGTRSGTRSTRPNTAPETRSSTRSSRPRTIQTNTATLNNTSSFPPISTNSRSSRGNST